MDKCKTKANRHQKMISEMVTMSEEGFKPAFKHSIFQSARLACGWGQTIFCLNPAFLLSKMGPRACLSHCPLTVIRHHAQRRQIITWDLQLQRDWSPSPSWQVAWQQAGRHNTRGAAESSHCETQPWGRENPGKRGGFWNLRVGLQWHTSSSPS